MDPVFTRKVFHLDWLRQTESDFWHKHLPEVGTFADRLTNDDPGTRT